jgi:hypothetical protein
MCLLSFVNYLRLLFLMYSESEDEPEALNMKALAIVNRVRDKLTGRDFVTENPIDVPTQVDMLIGQATSHEHLCQCYIGWLVYIYIYMCVYNSVYIYVYIQCPTICVKD